LSKRVDDCVVNAEKMKMDALYKKLKKAYAEDNLTQISAWIIDLYKNKQFLKIRKLSEVLSEYLSINSNESMNRCFSKLIATYHPDKGNYYRQEIENIYHSGKPEDLEQFNHIFIFQNKEQITTIENQSVDIGFEYEYEYVWDYEAEGYQYFNDMDDEDYGSDSIFFNEPINDGTFYSAVKRKIYGNMEIDLPAYYLEDFEEIGMADYEIENLDGIEHCIHVTKLDLSGNNLSDITDLCQLKQLEELYISGNQIYEITALGYLKKLRFIDLSYNSIDDLSPVLQLDGLQYINVVGNHIPESQLQMLTEKNVLIVS
jgi:Leucine-rich repeat (LRR) protein